LKEMAQMADFFFNTHIEYESKAQEKFLNSSTKAILERFLSDFINIQTLGEAEQRFLIEGITKDLGKKVVEVIQPIRVALSGKEVSPGIFEVIDILGRETVVTRITNAISSIL